MVALASSLVAVAVGCSDEQPAANGATATSAGIPLTTTTRDENQVQADVAEVFPETSVDSTVPEVSASSEPQTAGELIDGLQLDDIRWGDHDSYYRVVFDLSTTAGATVTQAPHVDALMSADGTEIEVTLGGIRGISARPNVLEQKLEIGDATVNSIERLPSMDDQALVYRINLDVPGTYYLASLGDPGRVIVDIYR